MEPGEGPIEEEEKKVLEELPDPDPKEVKQLFPDETQEDFAKEGIKHKSHHYSAHNLFRDDIALTPIDDTGDAFVYSRKVPVSPYSFVDETQEYSDESPPPTYLSKEELMVPLPIEKDEILQDLEFCNHGGL